MHTRNLHVSRSFLGSTSASNVQMQKGRMEHLFCTVYVRLVHMNLHGLVLYKSWLVSTWESGREVISHRTGLARAHAITIMRT